MRIVSGIGNIVLCGVCKLHVQPAFGKAMADILEHKLGYGKYLLLIKRLIEHYVVYPVKELGAEALLKQRVYLIARFLGYLAVLYAVQYVLAAKVAGHYYYGVLEVHRAALRIGHAAIVKHLQQHVENIRVRLFNLVEQYNAVRLPAHGLGKLTALIIANVSRRCAYQASHGVFLHVFAHVYTHHVVLVVKQRLGKRFCKLRLAHASGAEEQETAYGL